MRGWKSNKEFEIFKQNMYSLVSRYFVEETWPEPTKVAKGVYFFLITYHIAYIHNNLDFFVNQILREINFI